MFFIKSIKVWVATERYLSFFQARAMFILIGFSNGIPTRSFFLSAILSRRKDMPKPLATSALIVSVWLEEIAIYG